MSFYNAKENRIPEENIITFIEQFSLDLNRELRLENALGTIETPQLRELVLDILGKGDAGFLDYKTKTDLRYVVETLVERTGGVGRKEIQDLIHEAYRKK